MVPDTPVDPGASDLNAAKRAMRERINAALRAMSAEQRVAESSQIVAAITGWLGEFSGTPTTAMIFSPMVVEPDISPLVAALLARGWRVCAPSIDWPDGQMRAAVIADWQSDLVPARMGLKEPRKGLPLADPADIDLILVPGLAFDRSGGRLGRGKGYYDRFLATVPPSAVTIGMCFTCQIVERVPMNEHDWPVGQLVWDLK